MIAPTAADVRDVMIEGPAGLLSCYPRGRRPIYRPSIRQVKFQSGAIGIVRSADEPERLRGPQFTKLWADEFCAWRFLAEAWDQISFGFRSPVSNLRGIITTTPKYTKTFADLLARPSTVLTRGSSFDNRANLSPAYYREVIQPYLGTRLGRQEIEGELISEVPGALWSPTLLDATRIRPAEMRWEMVIRVVIGVDPAVSIAEESSETGIVVVAELRSGHLVVLDDLSCRESPIGWAKIIQSAARTRRADRIIGEVNNGGLLVERNLHALDDSLPFRAVHASHGKYTRAEPVATLYERGQVHHLGVFSELEKQMTNFVPGADRSPDRMDALVWAITHLRIDPETRTRVLQVGEPVKIEY
jgi:phage terminase large subunit-like protein